MFGRFFKYVAWVFTARIGTRITRMRRINTDFVRFANDKKKLNDCVQNICETNIRSVKSAASVLSAYLSYPPIKTSLICITEPAYKFSITFPNISYDLNLSSCSKICEVAMISFAPVCCKKALILFLMVAALPMKE